MRPHLDGSYRIDEGLRIARQLLIDIYRPGRAGRQRIPGRDQPQYIGDLISWGAIGARTTESQFDRELASGISAPIGFKNGTDGNIRIATDAIQSASPGHHLPIGTQKRPSGHRPHRALATRPPRHPAAALANAQLRRGPCGRPPAPIWKKPPAPIPDGGLQPRQQPQTARAPKRRGGRHCRSKSRVARAKCLA